MQLEEVADHRESLRKNPHLRWLFFEITNRCNLKCRHCGSNCSAAGESLSLRDIERTLESLKSCKDRPMICLTGGEPMLHPGFFGIAECIRSNGFLWGMTTNATLIDDDAAKKLRQAGMATVSVLSIDFISPRSLSIALLS